MLLLYIALGGVIGTLLRYVIGGWVHQSTGTWLPWGTLIINVSGSFLLGFIMRATQSVIISPELRGMLTIGLCGAFTTFSTYTYETFALVQEGAWGRAALYSFGSLAAGFAALVAGTIVAALILRPGG
jgi:CrcB protein